MQKGNKIAIIFLVFVAIAVGLYLLFETPADVMTPLSEAEAAMEFDNSDMSEEKDGKTLWRIKADHVRIESNKNIIHLTGVKAFWADGDNEFRITAKKGIYNKKKQTVYVEGNVVGKTRDGLVLHSKNLTYNLKTQILSTDKFFTAEKDNRVLTGNSFTADRVMRIITAKGNAKLADKEVKQ